jgi:hypothetical protein
MSIPAEEVVSPKIVPPLAVCVTLGIILASVNVL